MALVGDYNPEVIAHQAIPVALELAAKSLGIVVAPQWCASEKIDLKQLVCFNAIWCVPASPYRSMFGALAAINYARVSSTPFLGTCGGYQHAVLEYVRNHLGYKDADNAEVNPSAAMPVIAPLSCSLVETSAEIILQVKSRLAAIYGAVHITEQYHCSYGVNPEYLPLFDNTDVLFSGRDAIGEPRALELREHRFFIATAYQPERSALQQFVHPIVLAFLAAVLVG